MLPKKIFYVEVLPGGTPLAYRQIGGKIFTTKQHAINHQVGLERSGKLTKLWEIDPPNWKESKD